MTSLSHPSSNGPAKYPRPRDRLGRLLPGTAPWEDPALSLEARERLMRESRVADLLPQEEEEDRLGRAYDGRLLRRLAGYIHPYRGRMALAVVLMVVSSLLSVAGPWTIGQAIDQGIQAGDMGRLRFWTLVFLATLLGEWLANRSRIALMAYVGTRIVADVRRHLFRHLLALSLHFFHRYSVGRLMSRLISDVGVLQDFVTWSITGVARAVFVLLGIVIAMVGMNLRLALVAFSVLPLMVLLTDYWRRRVREAYRATRRRLALINGFLNESISGVRIIKSFVRERINARHFDELNRAFFDANIQAARLAALFFPGVDGIGALAKALVVGVGGWLVLDNALTPGTLVAFVLYVDRFFDPIRDLAQRYNTFQATMAASERIFQLLDTEPDLQDRPGAYELPRVRGHVRFHRVSFGYVPGQPVLQDFTLEARPGERVALVGETGAGKSTVIRLLARFYDPTSGCIQVDGHDIRQVTRASLRRQMGIVLQDTFLFSGTIRENIRYGRLDATDGEVEAAARAVGAHDFIAQLEKGYDTEVGEHGIHLSVGQRQILAFARALLADPRILVLDEATSSVDTETERQIQAALERLLAGRTSFVIAHRLNTIVHSHKIVVLDRGRIVEMGTHPELLARGGRYHQLYTLQWARQPAEAPRREQGVGP